MKYPEGALKSIDELKEAAMPGAVLYMIFGPERFTNFRLIIDAKFKVTKDHKRQRWNFEVRTEDFDNRIPYGKQSFWSPYGDLHFPTAENFCGYLFNNYWHAYAYLLRQRKIA